MQILVTVLEKRWQEEVPASWLLLLLYCHKLLVTFENYGSLSLWKLCLPVGACTLEWVYPISRISHAGPRIAVHASWTFPQLRLILGLWCSANTGFTRWARCRRSCTEHGSVEGSLGTSHLSVSLYSSLSDSCSLPQSQTHCAADRTVFLTPLHSWNENRSWKQWHLSATCNLHHGPSQAICISLLALNQVNLTLCRAVYYLSRVWGSY